MSPTLLSTAAILLLIAGLVHAIPALDRRLEALFGGTPVIQVIVGIASVAVALAMLFSGREVTAPAGEQRGGQGGGEG